MIADLHRCPLCSSHNTAVIAAYERCVTSDSRTLAAPIENLECADCGAVFNPVGRTAALEAFYAQDYDLLADSPDAEFVYSDDEEAAARGINDQMLDFIDREADLPAGGALLEVGCGKGVFLRKFAARRPNWRYAAVEPGAAAKARMTQLPTGTEFHAGTFQTSPFLGRQFDFVAAVGVLEHVVEPVGFLRAMAGCTRAGGALFLSVPDFALNPADLLTFDHLTRFTPDVLRRAVEGVGLTVTHQVHGKRVPMWLLARKGAETAAAPPPPHRPGVAAGEWVAGSIAQYARLRCDMAARPARLAIYGTGLIAFGALAQGALAAEDIACFIDDNPHLHGSSRLGRPVVSLAQAVSEGVTDIAFSANPVYLQVMEARARAAAPQANIWLLPPYAG
jgi:2-polyprenyl-3-methyl-5-hydroxy-6-metoxy-1,4-benzoquinol methylase